MLCIDTHQHLWHYTAEEYGWIDERMLPLRQDFLPNQLQAAAQSAAVHQCLAVQARQTLAETEWLLALAEEHSLIAGVIGWAPVASPAFPALLEPLLAQRSLKGFRHILQGEANPNYALESNFSAGLDRLSKTKLVYEILLYAHQLSIAVKLADQHPDQSFVLDHLGKPQIACAAQSPAEFNLWRTHLVALAERPNIACKLSGLATEANWECWSLEQLRPYLDVALTCFGPERLMVGSDWPVCTLATSYERWWQTLRDWCSSLSQTEQAMIMGTNAQRIYHLDRKLNAADAMA